MHKVYLQVSRVLFVLVYWFTYYLSICFYFFCIIYRIRLDDAIAIDPTFSSGKRKPRTPTRCRTSICQNKFRSNGTGVNGWRLSEALVNVRPGYAQCFRSVLGVSHSYRIVSLYDYGILFDSVRVSVAMKPRLV